MIRIIRYLLLFIILVLFSCVKKEQEDKKYAIKNELALQVLHENFSWNLNILNSTNENLSIRSDDSLFLVENFLNANFVEVEETIKKMKDTFADTSNVSFFISQLKTKVDSVIDRKIFEGFSNKDKYEIISLKDQKKYSSKKVVCQMSIPLVSKTGGLVFVVNRCWVKGVKKEWLNGFVWNKEKSKYEIYLAIGLGSENDFAYEFSKDGDFR